MRARRYGLRRQRRRLTDGDVSTRLREMAVPMLAGLGAVIGFNAVDTFFVAMLGTDALAAISFTFPIVLLVGGIGIGLGIGVSAVLARAIGRDEEDDVLRLVNHAIALAVTTGLALMAVLAWGTDSLVAQLGASDHLVALVLQYTDTWLLAILRCSSA